jgi:hypothetical protein
VSPSPAKVKVVAEWVKPENLNELRVFLGFTNYYRKFVPSFSHIAQPLNDLTKKGAAYEWTSKCQTAFDTLKIILTSSPVLILPHTGETARFVLSTDASGFAIGAILLQDQGLGLQPVEYYARNMNAAEHNYPVHAQELLAIVAALKHWRHYLEGCAHFLVTTDHSTLTHFKTQASLSRRQAGWLETISPYFTNMDIPYRRGELNQSDGLSRQPELIPRHRPTNLPELFDQVIKWERDAVEKQFFSLNAVFTVEPPESFKQQILAGYTPEFVKGLPRFCTTAAGLYYMNTKIVVHADIKLRRSIMQHFHDELGHYGIVRLPMEA